MGIEAQNELVSVSRSSIAATGQQYVSRQAQFESVLESTRLRCCSAASPENLRWQKAFSG